MSTRSHLALIGSGPSTIYLLKHLLDHGDFLKGRLETLSIFEKSQLTGMGMPYSPLTTDRYNLSNISSEELPELPATLVEWLRSLDPDDLQAMDLTQEDISAETIYPRLVLGQYLHAQYREMLTRLQENGITVTEHPGCEITDIRDDSEREQVTLVTVRGETHVVDKAVIATGHRWENDRPEDGFYASPWPISKLLPKDGEYHHFAIGTLGASLSAFDVISSLAHRHGSFPSEEDGVVRYEPFPGTDAFKIVMHALHGWLPHLQFDQDEPFRDIYRHVSRTDLLGLVDDNGHLRLATYYDKVCRPALAEAFEKDHLDELVRKLADPGFTLEDFVETMADKHDYEDAFEGMRFEMIEARKSVLDHQPIHWKEVIDDLMYTLNFHADLMPSEDHLTLHSVVMPFLMNVIAAMPLESGRILLALRDAGKIEIVSGRATVADGADPDHLTTVVVEGEDGDEREIPYRMFIDCGGQRPLDLPDYPFESLVGSGAVRKARARFVDPGERGSLPAEKKEHLFEEGGETLLHLGGVDVDGVYRLIGKDGEPNPRICEIAFPHISGVRPYSYGLQCCSDTAGILVEAWIEELKDGEPITDDPLEISRVYEKL